jgi:hypothetical protein
MQQQKLAQLVHRLSVSVTYEIVMKAVNTPVS